VRKMGMLQKMEAEYRRFGQVSELAGLKVQ
jgi:hypothetical protein